MKRADQISPKSQSILIFSFDEGSSLIKCKDIKFAVQLRIQIMKTPIEFSAKRNFDRPGSEVGSYSTVSRKQSVMGAVSNYTSFTKTPFKADISNTDLSKSKSPEHVKSFLDIKQTSSGSGHASMLSNLKSQLTSLKQEVSRLAVNTNQPLEFKHKHKHDRSSNAARNGNTENRDCSFNLENRPPFVVQASSGDEPTTKRDLDRLRTQYAQKEFELAEQVKKISRLQSQLKQQKKSRQQLENQTEVVRNTCRQFKEQTEKLRQQLRISSQKQSAMFYDKREMLDKLHYRKEFTKEDFERKAEEINQAAEKQKNKLLVELNNQSDIHRKAIADIEKNYRQLEKQLRTVNGRLMSVENEKKANQQANFELIRRKDKQIGLLKQQIGILQQLTSTRAAEQNCLLLQKEAVEKMCSHKDQQNRRLNRQLTQLRQRFQCERSFSTTLSQKVGTKDVIIQNLQSQNDSLQNQLRELKEEQTNYKYDTAKQLDNLFISVQRIESEKLRLQGQVRLSHAELQTLRHSEKVAWEQYKVLQHELDKAKTKQLQVIQRSRMHRLKQSSEQEYIKQLQAKNQNLKSIADEIYLVKLNKSAVEGELERIKNGLDVTQERNIQLLERLKQKQNIEATLDNSNQKINYLQKQIQRAKNLQRLLIQQNSNVKRRESAVQQDFKNLQTEMGELRQKIANTAQLAAERSAKIQSLKGKIQFLKEQKSSLSADKQLQQEIKKLIQDSKNSTDMLAQSNKKANSLAQEITSLKSQMQRLRAQNDSLKKKMKDQQNAIKQSSGSTIQQRALRDQCGHKDGVIRDLRGAIQRLQHNLHAADNNIRRLQRTEQILFETNEVVARLRLRQLEQRMQQSSLDQII